MPVEGLAEAARPRRLARRARVEQETVRDLLVDMDRRKVTDITLFKSVGTAIEDLAAAMLVWRTLRSRP
jgi:ornithine cyclodeaminase